MSSVAKCFSYAPYIIHTIYRYFPLSLNHHHILKHHRIELEIMKFYCTSNSSTQFPPYFLYFKPKHLHFLLGSLFQPTPDNNLPQPSRKSWPMPRVQRVACARAPGKFWMRWIWRRSWTLMMRPTDFTGRFCDGMVLLLLFLFGRCLLDEDVWMGCFFLEDVFWK